MTPTIVAEMSGNHGGSIGRAMRIIDAAHNAGVDAVKIQCFTPEQMVSAKTVITSGPWAGRNALELYRETHLPQAWIRELSYYAREQGVTLFASVFHSDDVDFMEELQCPMYKIASFEITDLALIKRAAATKKPMILSAGMASAEEIEAAVWTAAESGRAVTLLKCTSAYPAPPAELNLKTISELPNRFGVHAGLSDHTLGLTAAVVATALGATMIEKHLTLNRNDGGPDAAFSAEPHELAALVKACREAYSTLGQVRYGPVESESDCLQLRREPGGMRGEPAIHVDRNNHHAGEAS